MSEPIVMSGLHNLTLKNYDTQKPLITCKRLIDFTLPGKVDTEAIYGGDIRYAAEAEPKNGKAMATLGFREWPEELFEYFMAASVTAGTAEPAGYCSTLTNVQGTTVQNATNGILSIQIDALGTHTALLRTGNYTVVATGSAAADLYIDTDVDFRRGDTFPDKTGKLTATPITISGTSPVSLGYGLTYLSLIHI